MADYRFVTTMEIAVPREQVWAEVSHPERWKTWWPGLNDVKQLEPGDDEGRGMLLEFVFKGFLPYTLSFHGRITRIESPHRMDIDAVGELEGNAVYELEDLGETTRMRLTWTVKTTKTWMNVLAPAARPFFAWNHDILMRAGARGLARKLGSEVTRFEAGHPWRRPALLVVALVAGLRMWKLARSGSAR
jgi:uncharacterized protein YndB with AHSA1/START domain